MLISINEVDIIMLMFEREMIRFEPKFNVSASPATNSMLTLRLQNLFTRHHLPNVPGRIIGRLQSKG